LHTVSIQLSIHPSQPQSEASPPVSIHGHAVVVARFGTEVLDR